MSQPSAVHCSCCHACHVSMKQRPRPLLACAECNNIYCSVCLSTRWKTDKWAEGQASADNWQCPKCAGECICKSCSKLRAPAARKRPVSMEEPQSAEEREYEFEDADESLLVFSAPARANVAQRARVGAGAEQPGRQPVLPAGFQPSPTFSPASSAALPSERALGMLHYDSSTPVHRKALELARQRDHVDGTINNMKHLLAMLEQERTVLDAALTVLIKQTTSQVGLARTASVAAFEDLLLSPPNNKMRRSASQQFNLDVIDTSSVVAPPRY